MGRNQLEQAEELVRRFTHITKVKEALNDLRFVMACAQNAPPGGESDGTIDERTWFLIKDIVDTGESFLRCVRRFEQEL